MRAYSPGGRRCLSVTTIVIFILSIHPVSSDTLPNRLGGEIGYIARPFGAEDPYSWALGASIFYERHDILASFPLFAGACLTGYGFYTLQQDYGPSFMIQGGGYAGYDFKLPLHSDFTLAVSPFVGYSHYWRTFEFQKDSFESYRPVMRAGAQVSFEISDSLGLGLSLETQLLIEKTFLAALRQAVRVDWRF